jgi:CHAT domain-containing protein
MTTALARASDALVEPPGLIIEEVTVGSLAERSALKVGDKLLTYDDRPLPSVAALQAAQQNTVGKKQVVLHLWRGGGTLTLTVPVGRLGLTIRPELSPAVLALYTESKAAKQEQKIDMAVVKLMMAAKAAEESGEKSAAAWLYWRTGITYEEQAKWKEAQEVYTAGWESLKGNSDAAAQSQMLEAISWCNRNLNAFSLAQQWLEQALQVNMAAGYEIWVAADLTDLGNLAFLRRDFRAAENNYNRALIIYNRLTPGSLDAADALNNLGNVAYSRGDLQAAHDYLRSALKIRERLDPGSSRVAASLSNMGSIAHARGDLKAAEDYYHNASVIYDRVDPNSTDAADTISDLGSITHSRGDLEAAQGYYNRALKIRERVVPDSTDVAFSLDDLGAVEQSRGNLQSAEDYFIRALKIRERIVPNSLDVAYSMNHLGRVAYSRGDLKAAENDYRNASEIYERLAPDSLDAAANVNDQGYIALEGGRFQEALRLFTHAVTILELQRSRIPSIEARAFLVGGYTNLYSGLLRTNLALNNLSAAFATVERARARSMIELLGERRLSLRADAPADLLKRQDELDENRSTAYSLLKDVYIKLNDTRYELSRAAADDETQDVEKLKGQVERFEKHIDELRAELTGLSIKQQELEEEIRRASPKLSALKYPETLDLKTAQAVLDTDTLLLTYYVAQNETYLFAVTKSDIKVFTLPAGEDTLNSQIKAFRNKVAIYRIDLHDPLRLEEASQQGKELYDALVRPAQEFVNRAKRILICPDGPLHVLPFAALVSQTKPTLRYFTEDKPLHMISSMTVYAETRRPATENKQYQMKLLAFGDPLYSKQQTEAAKIQPSVQTAPNRRREQRKAESEPEVGDLLRKGFNLDALPWTRREVEGISRLFGNSATIKMGQQATETVARQASKDYSILHFAVHGWLDDQIGLNSALALSQPEIIRQKATRDDNGLWQAWEIFEHARLNADLVVLSACETGLGQNIRGEGLIGLTRAFQYAGAKSIVVSLWEVNDASTAEFMTVFYKELRKGVSKDVALQTAMRTMRNTRKWHHPFYWSPFILVGNWR